MKTARALLLFVGFAALVLGGCSSGGDGSGGSGGTGGGTGEATIGSEGGTLTTTDGRLTLTVPPGALSGDQQIRIAPIDLGQAPDSVQSLAGALTVYDLQPAGLQFAIPARLDVNVPDAVIRSANNLALQVAFLLSESDGAVVALENQSYAAAESVATDAIVSADIDHFSSAVVQFFNGATLSADVPSTVDVGMTFDVTVTIDIDGAGLGTLNQAVLSDSSIVPVSLVGDLDEAFVGTPMVQTVTNTYTCTEAGIGRYRTVAGFEVENDLGPLTGTELSADVTCVVALEPFEVADAAPAGIGRAPGSIFAAYATRNGATVLNLTNGDVLQRVARTDDGDFPLGSANVYAPDGQIQAIIATDSIGVSASLFAQNALTPIAFIPMGGGGENLQYAPGRFASIGGSAYFFDIDEAGVNAIESLNGAMADAGVTRLVTGYVPPAGFSEESSMLAVRFVGNPAVDPPELVSLELSAGVVTVNPIPRENTPDPLNMPSGAISLKCVPDPARPANAICGASVSGEVGGFGLFRWIPAEIPRLQIEGILSQTGGGLDRQFVNLDLINTSEGTRIASTNLEGTVRIDDVETDRSAGGTTTSFLTTPGQCGTGVDVEFRNSGESVLLACLDIDSVVTLDLPEFGGSGAGGTGGAGGAGGSGSCVDDIGARPTLTAPATLTPSMAVPGDQITVAFPVSSDTRLVRVTVFDGFSAIVAQDTATTIGGETVEFMLTISGAAVPNRDHFVGVLLCNDVGCIEDPTPTSVTYSRGSSTAGLGDPYFINVRDAGVGQTQINTFSCYDLLVLRVVSP